jgi:hypothetical protein
MSETNDESRKAERREEPEVGLIADEDLPEDLRPTDDNPLAKDPDKAEDDQEGKKAEGVPDLGEPGPGGA